MNFGFSKCESVKNDGQMLNWGAKIEGREKVGNSKEKIGFEPAFAPYLRSLLKKSTLEYF